MFDLGFGELVLFALVALIVLGPERLPKAARFAGLWVRRARAQWYSVKSELERELAAEELKKSVDEARSAAAGFEKDVRAAVADLDSSVREKAEAARGELRALRDGLEGADAPADAAGADAADPGAIEAPALPQPSAADAPALPRAADAPPADPAPPADGGDDVRR